MFDLLSHLHSERDTAPASDDHRVWMREVWISFASLLRAYVAAAELHRPEPHTVLTTHALRITLEHGRLHLTLDLDGQHWSLVNAGKALEAGAVSLDQNSRLTWQGQALELDAAAEAITEFFLDRSDREIDTETVAEAAGEAGGE